MNKSKINDNLKLLIESYKDIKLRKNKEDLDEIVNILKEFYLENGVKDLEIIDELYNKKFFHEYYLQRNDIRNIPINFMTKDMLGEYILLDYKNTGKINVVPVRNITNKVIDYLLVNDKEIITKFPSEWYTYSILEHLMELDNENIKYLKVDYLYDAINRLNKKKSYEKIKIISKILQEILLLGNTNIYSINIDKDCIKYVLDKDFCKTYAKEWFTIKGLPKEYITVEMLEAASTVEALDVFLYLVDNNISDLKNYETGVVYKDKYEILFDNAKDYSFVKLIPENMFNEEVLNTFLGIRDGKIYHLERTVFLPYRLMSRDICFMCIMGGYAHTNDKNKLSSSLLTFDDYYDLYKYNKITLKEFLEDIKEENKTDEYWEIFTEYAEDSNSVVPDEYFNADIALNLFKRDPLNIINIPEKYITSEMAKYVSDYVESVQSSIKDLNIYKRIIEKIDDEYKSINMWNFLVNNDLKTYFKRLPKEYITQVICDVVFSIDKEQIKYFPLKFINDEMLGYSYQKLVNEISKNETISDDEINLFVISEYPSLFNAVDKRIQEKVILFEFSKLEDSGYLFLDIANKYNIDLDIIENIYKKIKKSNKTLYDTTTNGINNNKKDRENLIASKAIDLKNIINKLGEIKEELSDKQKVLFTYLLIKSPVRECLDDVFRYAANNYNKDAEMMIVFNFMIKYLKCSVFQEDIFECLSNNVEWALKENVTWMLNYNICSDFLKSSDILNLDGKTLTFSDANNVISKLEDKNIPIRNCIVREAYREYLKSNLDNFIDELISLKKDII